MVCKFLTVLPVYNEVEHVAGVLDEVLRYGSEILVVDDGSRDGTSEVLATRSDVQVIAHRTNRGYGAALMTAFRYAILRRYDAVVTIDCDGQHEPQRIPEFVEACAHADIVSGSRYLKHFPGDVRPPADRREINQVITGELNELLNLELTDTFCGFKAYRTQALARLCLTEPGYAMPLELWVQAKFHGLRVMELPVPLIYLDETRSFGGVLDNANRRLAYYRRVLHRSLAGIARSPVEGWTEGLCVGDAGRC